MRIPVLLVVCAVVGSPILTADIIYESATFAGSESGGAVLGQVQFVGARFTISSPVQITAIGGDIGEGDIGEFRPGGLFGAIVSLSGPNALPSCNPFDSTTIASVVFDAPYPSEDISIALSVTLEPGSYGLIFGGGEFGSSGTGFIGTGDPALPGANGFAWNLQSAYQQVAWTDSGMPTPGETISAWSFMAKLCQSLQLELS